MITNKLKENIMQNSEKTILIVRNLNDKLANAVDLKREGSFLYAFSYYDVQAILHGVKNRDASAYIELVLKFYKSIPKNASLIPLPSSDGSTSVNLELLSLIQSLRKDIKIIDILRGRSRESLYKLKKEQRAIPNDFFGFYLLKNKFEINNNTYLFDAVVDTGTTYKAAAECIGVKLPLLVFANNTKTPKVNVDVKPLEIFRPIDKIYYVRYFFLGCEISDDEEPGHSKYAHVYCVALTRKDAEDKVRKHALNYFNRVCAIDDVKLAENQDLNYYTTNKKTLIY